MRQLGSFLPGHRTRRRGGALERPDVAVPSARLHRVLEHGRSLRQVGDPGRTCRSRTGASPTTSSSRTTTSSSTWRASPARPGTSRAGSSQAATSSRGRAHASTRCKRAQRPSWLAVPEGGEPTSATTRSRGRSANLPVAVQEPRRDHPRRMHVLRLLRAVRLRGRREGRPDGDRDPAGAEDRQVRDPRLLHAFAIKNDGKTGQSVLYFDSSGRIQEQPADIIILAAYVFNNVRTLLMSKLGKPYDPVKRHRVVGRNYCYQTGGGGATRLVQRARSSSATWARVRSAIGDRRLQRRQLRPLAASGSSAAARSRPGQSGARPIQSLTTPPGTPPFGTRLEGRDPEVLRERDQRRLPGRVARVPDALPRPRPELPGQLRQPAGPDHVRLGGERAQDGRVSRARRRSRS